MNDSSWSDRRWFVACVALALAVGFGLIQLLTYMAVFGYCDENWRPGSGREELCGVLDPWGYALLVAGSPLAIALIGVVASARRSPTILLWGAGAVLVAGTILPVLTTLLVGY